MNPRTLRQWAGLAPPRSLAARTTALILIDFQEDYAGGRLPIPNLDQAVAQAARLLHWARREGIAVIHVRQQAASAASPLFAPGSPGVEFLREVAPQAGEKVVVKSLPSSFRGTELQRELEAAGIEILVLCGLMTHMCVDSTAREGMHLGFRILVVADACASRDLPDPAGRGTIDHETVHRTALAALGDRFADLFAAADLLRLPVEG